MTTGAPLYVDMSDPAAVKKWEQRLFQLAMRETVIFNPANGLVRDDEDGVVHRKTEPFKSDGGGARATFTLVHDLEGEAAYGNENLHGKEMGLTSATDTLDINNVRIAASVDGEIVEQRIPWATANLNQKKLARKFQIMMEASALMHLTGFAINAATASGYAHEKWLKGNSLANTFGHTPRTPDDKHFYRPNDHTTDEDIAADQTAIIDLNVIEDVTARAKQLLIPIRKAKIGKGRYWVFFLHTDAVKVLRRQETEWWQYMTSRIQGGEIDGNPIKTGGEGTRVLGEYQETIFFETSYLPPGIHSSTSTPVAGTRRWVFGGAQMLLLGLGKRYSNENQFKFRRQEWDYGDKWGIATGMLAGMRSPRFHVPAVNQDHDYGKIAGTSYVEDSVSF